MPTVDLDLKDTPPWDGRKGWHIHRFSYALTLRAFDVPGVFERRGEWYGPPFLVALDLLDAVVDVDSYIAWVLKTYNDRFEILDARLRLATNSKEYAHAVYEEYVQAGSPRCVRRRA